MNYLFYIMKIYLRLQSEESLSTQLPEIDDVFSSQDEIHFPAEKMSQG